MTGTAELTALVCSGAAARLGGSAVCVSTRTPVSRASACSVGLQTKVINCCVLGDCLLSF
jgi:hypothetical protein